MRFRQMIPVLCLAAAVGQIPQKHKSNPTPKKPNATACIAEMARAIPARVINQYSNSGPDSLINVYSDDKVDVYTDQRVIDAYIGAPVAYSGEFSGLLYFTFHDETMRQTIIKKISSSRPAYFNRNMACPDFDSQHPLSCNNGGPLQNPDFLKYVAADITFSIHGPGNVLLPPGATIPSRLFIIGSVLYLSSPRCAGLGAFDKAVAKSIPSDVEYINALAQPSPNSTLIGETYGGGNRDEFMALFVDSSTRIASTVLPGDYQVGDTDNSLLSRSMKGAALKITEGRQIRSERTQTQNAAPQPQT